MAKRPKGKDGKFLSNRQIAARKAAKKRSKKGGKKTAAKPSNQQRRSPVAKKKKSGGGRRRRSGNPALKSAMFAIAGGATGAVVGHMLRENKVKPSTVAVGMVATGLVGAVSLTGNAKWFAAGVATSGASQYSRAWAEAKLKRKGLEDGAASVHQLHPSRNQPVDQDVLAAFQAAQDEIADIQKDAA